MMTYYSRCKITRANIEKNILHKEALGFKGVAILGVNNEYVMWQCESRKLLMKCRFYMMQLSSLSLHASFFFIFKGEWFISYQDFSM